ncbi:hypothetical protein OSB04_015201 [Centaurea solstitialis]|uniref:PPM-type phosphatase domain-containing protein n=1 Tax=Centaurea solstitialis TaxID=347529 RepID=A0AA38T9Q7_9ASTR|nr:hypothetical protein OSB04_015201 [Centaurea solstitialis]
MVMVAEFCSSHLHEKVFEFWEAQYSMDTSIGTMEAILTKAFQYVDDLVAETFDENVGSTAVVVLVTHTHLITANCGDSRAVLSRGGEAIPLSVDHKPDVSEERSRIESLGGLVLDYPCPWVYGILAMSPAIGMCIVGTYMNLILHPWVIPIPEVRCVERAMDDECVIIATDGLWDMVSSDETARIATHVLPTRRGRGGSKIAVEVAAVHLMKLAIKRGSSDNISVIVADLKSPQPMV